MIAHPPGPERPGHVDGDSVGYSLPSHSIVVFPILYGVMGLIGGAIGAVLFNFGARFGGGLQIDVQ